MRNNSVTFYRYSIILMAVLVPSAFYGGILAVLGLVFLFWLFAGDYKNIPAAIRRPYIFWPLVLYAVVVIGFFFSQNFGEALRTLSTKLPLLLFPLIIGTASVADKKLADDASRWFVYSTSLFLAIALGYAFYDVMATGVDMVAENEAVYNKFTSYGLTRVFHNWHPTYVGMFANLSIAILLHGFMNQASLKPGKLVYTILQFLFLSVCIFLLNSIIAILAYVVLLVYFMVRYLAGLNLQPLYKTMIAAFFIFLGFSVLYFNPFRIQKIDTLRNRELKLTDKYNERNVLTIRLAKWDAHWQVIKKHWLLGTTEGDIKAIRKQAYQQKGYHDLARMNYNAHNQYIEVWATYGIVGLFIFLALLLQPVLKKGLHPYLIPFMLITCIIFLTETVLNRQQGILYFMFFYTLLATAGYKDRVKVPEG